MNSVEKIFEWDNINEEKSQVQNFWDSVGEILDIIWILSKTDLYDEYKKIIEKTLKFWDNWKYCFDITFLNNDNSNLVLEDFQKSLSLFITSLIDLWYCFCNLNRPNLEILLYWSKEEIKSLWNFISIWDTIKWFNLQISAIIYESVPISLENKKWNYSVKFWSESDFYKNKLIFTVWEDNINDDIQKIVFDDFFAYMWLIQWIKFWFQYDEFKKDYEWKNREVLNWKDLLVAVRKESTNWIDDEKSELIKLDISRKLVTWEAWKLEWGIHIYECIFPTIKKWNNILLMKKWDLWINWIDIRWSKISSKEWKRILPNDFLLWNEKYVEIEYLEDWSFYLKALCDLYIQKDNRNWKLTFSLDKVNKLEIWPNTWCLILPRDWTSFTQKAWIQKGYFIDGDNIKVEQSDIYWTIKADNDIRINGRSSINWWKNTSEDKCEKIYSRNWDIYIEEFVKIQNHAKIFAPNWKVFIEWDLEHTIIYWDEIDVLWTATNCIFVWRNIKLKTNNWSKILWENIFVESDIKKWDNYILAVYSWLTSFVKLIKSKVEILTNEIIKINIKIKELKEQYSNVSDLNAKKLIANEWKKLVDKVELFTNQMKSYEIVLSLYKDNDKALFVWKSIDADIRVSFIPFILNDQVRNRISSDIIPDKIKLYNFLIWFFDSQWKDKILLEWQNWNFSYTRKQIFSILDNYLESTNQKRDSEIVEVLKQWRKIDIVVNNFPWYLNDYSDNWSSFVFSINNPFELHFKENNTIPVKLFWKEYTFYITRIDTKEKWKTTLVRISWHYIELWVWKFIQAEINKLETEKWKINKF